MPSFAELLSRLSSKERQLAQQAIKEREARDRKAADALDREVNAAMDGLRRRLHDLLGAEGLRELRQGMQQERVRFRDLMQPPQGLQVDFANENAERARRGNALLQKLGVSAEQLRAAGRETDARLHELLLPSKATATPGYHLESNLQQWMDLSPLHKFPLPWGVQPEIADPSPNPWTLYRPPFFGFDFHFIPQVSDNFVVDHTMTLIPGSALVGHEVTMDCNDAGDFDYASGTADTAIAFAYEPPTTGILQILIDAQNISCTHDLTMHDHWGWSDGWDYQYNYLMSRVLLPDMPDPQLALMSQFGQEFDDDDHSYHQESLTFGQHYFAFLQSPGPVPAGQTVIIEAGTRTFDIGRANDIGFHSKSNFLWLINSIEVRIAP